MMKKKLFIGVYNPSIILTYISVFCSIIGIANLMKSETIASFDYMRVAIPLLIVAGVCDMFDGTVARMCKRTQIEKDFGVQLDSLADTVSFVVFPACMLTHMGNYSIASMIIACAYVFAGIMRLGWFNVTVEENKGFFQGLPVTLASVIVPAVYVVLTFFKVTDFAFELAIYITFALIAFLFIFNFRLNKPKTKTRIALAILAVAIIAMLFFI